MMMKIQTTNRKRQPVFCQYDSQCFPQGAYLEFDPMTSAKEEIVLTADYSGEIGNGVPMSVWHNLILRFGIPSQVTLKALNALQKDKDFRSMLEQLRDDYDQVWNGSNYVGKFDTDLYHCVCHYTQERLYSLMEQQR
jgi:hypothetical protein